MKAAPLWLRFPFAAPVIDRFAYPLLVKRGLGYLRTSPEWPPERLNDARGGWHIDPPGYEPLISTARPTRAAKWGSDCP